jgi:D-alanine-D-alanine ligase
VRVAVLFDDVTSRAQATADERGVLEAVDAVVAVLERAGHEALRIPVTPCVGDWIGPLLGRRADVAFNLCEGVGGSSAHEPHVAAVIELVGLPMTGCGAATLSLGRQKDRVNAVLGAAAVPVPRWTRVGTDERAPAWDCFPAIVKPAAEDASIGITQRSVVRNAAELDSAIDESRAFGVAIVQAFMPGRELNVGIVGDDILPVAEIDFAGVPERTWPIVSYRAKWETGSDEDLGTVPRCPADLSAREAREVVSTAAKAWRLAGGRGYGRVDLRGDEAGRFHVLEINPHPDLAPSAGLARMGRAHGWSYDDLVLRILALASS